MGVQEARAPLEAAQFELCGFVCGPLRMAKRAQLIEAIEEESLAKATAFLADAPLSVTHDEMRAACWQGNLNIFNLLVEQGGNAYISAIDAATQRSLLHDAAQHGNSSVCKRLLELGVDPTLVSTQDGCTAAELAARNDWPATVAIFNNHVATAPVVPASTPTAAPTQPTSLEELLARLDLSKFAPTLAAEDIDLDMAYKLTEEEFAKLGLTIGARRKLYAALHPAGGSAAPAAGALSPPPVPAPAAKAPPPSPLPAKVSAVVVKSPLVRTPVTPTTAASKPVATAPPSPLVKAPAAAAPLKPPALAASKPPPAPLAKPPAPVVARAVTAPVTPPASPPAPASDSASASESASTSTSASASAYTCAEGHAMAVETRFAFTCDKCGADGGQVVTRWRCAQCKFDMCNACAPLPPTEAGGGGSTEAPAPAPAPAGPLLFCSKAHPLAVLTSYKFVCDKCHRSGCDVTTRWQCAQCQYDLCHACAPLPPGVVAAPVATQPASASDFKLSCKEGHALVPSTHRGGFSCSRCGDNSPAHSMSWRCQPCDYDICNKCSPLPDPGTVAALAPANLIAPGYHLTRCGAAGCRGFMGVAKKHGSCKVCKKEDPVPFGRFGSGLSSFDRPFGSTHSSAFGSNSSFGHSSSFGNNRMPLGSMHDPPRSSLTSSFASAAPEAPTAGARLVCAQGCGNSICEKCDAATQPARVVCTYCLSVFSKEKLPFHHTTCHAYTCPYPDCGRKFHNWSDRQEHMWEKCAISYINAQVGKANDERAAPDDDDSPSYHSSSSSSSFSSSHSSHSSHSRPAPAPKKCRRCDGTRVMNCRKCGGSGHDGMVKGVHKPCKTCGGGGKKSCDSC